MGAWGYAIEEDDRVLDILEEFVASLRLTQDAAATSAALREAYRDSLADPNSAVLVHIGLALAQWRYGALEPELLAAVKKDLEARRGIDDYTDPAAREKVLHAFVGRLTKPNPKPRAFPKPAKLPKRPRKPKPCAFAAGDCLLLQRAGGRCAAALVLAADQDSDGDGFNVIARLQWHGSTAPQLSDFAVLGQGPVAPGQALGLIQIAMYPHGPYSGNAELKILGNIPLDVGRFPVRKGKDWYWQSTRPGILDQGLPWIQWEQLGGFAIR